jgi:hypothetical protein
MFNCHRSRDWRDRVVYIYLSDFVFLVSKNLFFTSTICHNPEKFGGVAVLVVLAIKKSTYLYRYYNALSNKFSKYKAEWNVVKMNHSGKCESEILIFFYISC